MKIKSLCFFLIFTLTGLFGQNGTVKISIDGNIKELSSLNRKGADFVSARQLSRILEAPMFYNPSTAKLEMKFPGYLLKITGRNQFIIVTGQDKEPLIYQLPVSTLHAKDDILIPLEYAIAPLNRASGRRIEIKGGSGVKGNASVPGISRNNQEKTEDKTTVKETSKDKDAASSDEADKAALPGAAAKSSAFDITGLSIDVKANGTLLRIKSNKAISRYNTSVSKGVLYLNIAGLNADEKALRLSGPGGLIKKMTVKKMGNNVQLAFSLEDGYSTTETIPDGNDLLITIHNKTLSGSSSKQIERWELNTVVIDAGHGGKDPGAIGINGAKEKDINLSIALKLGDLIENNMPGVKVVYTRSDDRFVELYKRGRIANEHNGDLFISIHCNSTVAKPTNRSGFEVYLLRPGRTKEAISIAAVENSVIKYEDNPSRYKELTDENFILVTMAHSSYMRYSEHFSDILNRQFSGDLSLPSNGVKQAGFYVLVGASMPSVLVETGFLSNRGDAAYLAGKKGQKEMASSIYKAVRTFKDEYEKSLKAQL